MPKTKTTRYDVAEHLRTPEEMAAYLEACLDEPGADAAFIAKAIGDTARSEPGRIVLDDAAFDRVVAALESPAAPTDALRALMTKPRP